MASSNQLISQKYPLGTRLYSDGFGYGEVVDFKLPVGINGANCNYLVVFYRGNANSMLNDGTKKPFKGRVVIPGYEFNHYTYSEEMIEELQKNFVDTLKGVDKFVKRQGQMFTKHSPTKTFIDNFKVVGISSHTKRMILMAEEERNYLYPNVIVNNSFEWLSVDFHAKVGKARVFTEVDFEVHEGVVVIEDYKDIRWVEKGVDGASIPSFHYHQLYLDACGNSLAEELMAIGRQVDPEFVEIERVETPTPSKPKKAFGLEGDALNSALKGLL